MADKFQIGIMFDSAGQRMPLEAGMRTIGYTSHDVQLGKQVYWFPTIADFERQKKDIFETNYALCKPVPVMREIAQENPHAIELRGRLQHAKSRQHVEGIIIQFCKDIAQALSEDLRKETGEFFKGYETAMEEEPLPAKSDPFFVLGYKSYVKEPEPTPAPPAPELTPAPTPPAPEATPLPPASGTPAPLPEPTPKPAPEPTPAPSPKPSEAPTPEPTPAPLPAPETTPAPLPTADAVYQHHGGRAIRLNQLAEEMRITPEQLRGIVTGDARFAPIPAAGWIKRAS